MALDDRVYEDMKSEQPRNENLEGGKSTVSSVDEAKQEQRITKEQQKYTEPKKDPDEVKASAELLPSDAARKSEKSSGDSQ